jgi:hypothetical protein
MCAKDWFTCKSHIREDTAREFARIESEAQTAANDAQQAKAEGTTSVEPQLKEDVAALEAKLQEETKTLEVEKIQQVDQANQEYAKVFNSCSTLSGEEAPVNVASEEAPENVAPDAAPANAASGEAATHRRLLQDSPEPICQIKIKH